MTNARARTIGPGTANGRCEMNYDVRREHQGDRFYRQGDTRTADPSMVAHLVRSGVLVEAAKGGRKAEPKPDNKAEPKPANKAGS